MRVFSGALSGVLRVYRGCCKGLGVLSCKGQGFMVVVGFPADAVKHFRFSRAEPFAGSGLGPGYKPPI